MFADFNLNLNWNPDTLITGQPRAVQVCICQIWVNGCTPDPFSTFLPWRAHSSSAFLTFNQPRWGVQVQSSITGVSPFRPGLDNKGWVVRDRECHTHTHTQRAYKGFREMPIWVWTHIWGSKFYSRKRETLLRFSPVLDFYGPICYKKNAVVLFIFVFLFDALFSCKCFGKQTNLHLRTKRTQGWHTNLPFTSLSLSWCPPLSFLCVRAGGWDGCLLSARGSDNDTLQVGKRAKEIH